VAPPPRAVGSLAGLGSGRRGAAHPKMTACHFMMSLSHGAPFTPSGGSDCIRLKSRISLRRAGVLIPPAGNGRG
jgi:hypothetical protein